MKVRSGYVSNSSSSSYVIAYDKSFFGDLEKFLMDTNMNGYDGLGCETILYDLSDIDEEFYKYELCGDKEKIEKFKSKLKEAEKDGKGIIYIGLDHEYEVVINLLKFLNDNHGGDKIEFIYGDMSD